ncbi:MAG: hypothetical protein FWG72_09615 [Oscillospiraceae bacterium]|nr:hypothetical protein [Oscillospiraceae bacterium]
MLMLLLALLCGLGAAVLRGFQLTGSFDPRTALIERGDPVTVGLIVLSAVFTAAAAAFPPVSKPGGNPPPPPGFEGPP